jgi:hypothetical protein
MLSDFFERNIELVAIFVDVRVRVDQHRVGLLQKR